MPFNEPGQTSNGEDMNKARPVKGEKKLVGGRVLGTPEGGAMKIVLDQAACDGSATASSSCLNYWASTSVDSRSSPTVRLPASCCARKFRDRRTRNGPRRKIAPIPLHF